MPWLYDTQTGQVAFQNGTEAALQEATNIFNLFGSGEEVVNLGIPDSDTAAQALAAARNYVTAHPGSAAPTTSAANPLTGDNADSAMKAASGVVNGTGNALGSVTSDAAAVTTFLGDLTSRNLWVRVLKIVIGGTLLITGITRMTGTSSAVGKVARLGVWE